MNSKQHITLFLIIFFSITNYKSAAQFEIPGWMDTVIISSPSSVENIDIPAEFDEVKAMIVSWSPFPKDWKAQSELINAIQNECEAWVIVKDLEWEPMNVEREMLDLGFLLTNVRFFNKEEAGSVWVRDYGPMTFYHNNYQETALFDWKYDFFKAKDDRTPHFFSSQLQQPMIPVPLVFESGNLISDGFGSIFYTQRATERNELENSDLGPWTDQKISDTLLEYLNFKQDHSLFDLKCDGGTGHIDVFSVMFSEDHFGVIQFENSNSDVNWVENNVRTLTNLKSTYDRNYRVSRIPMPFKDDVGEEYSTCEEWNNDFRTYVNGLFVNKSYLLPIYSDENSGNQERDQQAIELFQKLLPGYNIVPIDSRVFSTRGGELHCITMHVPTDDPIKIWHPYYFDAYLPSNDLPFIVKIGSKHSIERVSLFHRIKGENSFQKENLSYRNLEQSYFTSLSTQHYSPSDTIEYYIEVENSISKIIRKPFVAPKAYHEFWFSNEGKPVGIKNRKLFSGKVFPNPTNVSLNLELASDNLSSKDISIFNSEGKLISSEYILQTSSNSFRISTSTLSNGIYILQINNRNTSQHTTFSVIH